MLSKWQWLLAQLTRTLWIRASLFAVLAIITALIAIPAQRMIHRHLPISIGADAVSHILNILASSMLAVTTFSLSIMVAAYSAATSNVTPRATQLLRQDSTTQTVLATFIGSFLFSLVGIIALSTNLYNDAGRLLLFIATLFVIVLIVLTILRWIEHLSVLGRVGETTNRVENAAYNAMSQRIAYPCLGANLLNDIDSIPNSAQTIYAKDVGYVCHVDVGALSAIAEQLDADIGVLSLTGTFVHPHHALVWLTAELTDEQTEQVRDCFTLGNERSFDQDPRFGLVVLAEIASRALSPAINDPGTAIDVIGRAVRILLPWTEHNSPQQTEEILYPRVYVPMLQLADLMEDMFTPIARDGASLIEIQLRLQRAFQTFIQTGNPNFIEQARHHAELAVKRAEAALSLEHDRQQLHTALEQTRTMHT